MTKEEIVVDMLLQRNKYMRSLNRFVDVIKESGNEEVEEAFMDSQSDLNELLQKLFGIIELSYEQSSK